MAWDSSTRKTRRGGSGWQEQKLHRTILAAQPHCRHCGQPATVVDDITPLAEGGNPRDPANKQPLCGPCHNTKTQAEAARARARNSRRRPAEPHPGLTGGG